jgi:uncharacterized protein YggE
MGCTRLKGPVHVVTFTVASSTKRRRSAAFERDKQRQRADRPTLEIDMKALFRATALSALILAGSAAAASAQDQAGPAPVAADNAFRATTFTFSASGETAIAPDMATISLGVTTDGATAGEALKANSARMSQVIAALKKGGIEARDIQTSGLNINPQYVYKEGEAPRLTGYQVSNQVTVIVRDLSRLGQAIDATVNAGANTVGGIAFGLQNPDAAEDAARMDAVKALQHKAELYARATGYRIVRLVTLNEGGGYQPPPPMPMAVRGFAKDATPVEAGELKVRIEVSATYEVAR